MQTPRLSLKHFGPLVDADVEFGDLTVLVGPQASGKSIFLQVLKLLLDTGPILRTLDTHGLDWNRKPENFLEPYLGEGMSKAWSKGQSQILWEQRSVDMEKLVRSKKSGRDEQAFLIPAQRVLTISRRSWLRPFTDYESGDPYCVRDFSDKLRLQMESLGGAGIVYPQPKRLKSAIRRLLTESIFGGFELRLDRTATQKRLLLTDSHEEQGGLPFMVWSAGQREFMPLLLGLYYLLPPTKVKRRGAIRWVIIEELEMGLHPKAIEALLFVVLDLIWRGYRVCLSTHSAHVLDVVWSLGELRKNRSTPGAVLQIFGVKPDPALQPLATSALKMNARVYYFDRERGRTRDISGLDPGSSEAVEAQWGGLTELPGRAADVVAQAVNRAQGT